MPSIIQINFCKQIKHSQSRFEALGRMIYIFLLNMTQMIWRTLRQKIKFIIAKNISYKQCLPLQYLKRFIIVIKAMPKIKTLRTQKAPKGFETIEPVIEQFTKQMKDAQNAPLDAQRKAQSYWKIIQIHHQQSRYIYNLYYGKKQISRELYDWLVRQKYADGPLIAKWKKNGYEKLCCLSCINTKDNNYKTTCVCRVPKADLQEGKLIMCKSCGCRGCSSID